MGYKTPILFINYNRPHLTRQSFAIIRKLQPQELFIACDGPHPNKAADVEKTEEVRAIVKEVDWKCSVNYKFSDSNKGCKIGVSSAIDWFFDQVEEGIILEDDIIPSPSFFEFAQAMLEMYRNEEKVMHVSGNNFLEQPLPNNESFYFSGVPHVWGWATWRRAWQMYSIEMKFYTRDMEFSHIKSPEMTEYFHRHFSLCADNKIDTWDYQWGFTLWLNAGLSITPAVNLIQNIGFDTDATHTKSGSERLKSMSGGLLSTPYQGPSQLALDHHLDCRMFFNHFVIKPKQQNITIRILQKIKAKLKSIQ